MRAFHPAGLDACLRFHDLPGPGTPLVFVHGFGCASSCDHPRIATDPALAQQSTGEYEALVRRYGRIPW